MTLEQVQSLYDEGIRYLTRYRRTEAIIEPNPDDSVDAESSVVYSASGNKIVGIMAGDPLEKLSALHDLGRISAIRGEVGLIISDLEAEVELNEDSLAETKAELFISKAEQVRKGFLESRNTDEAINNLVRVDAATRESRGRFRASKHALGRFTRLYDGLFGVENMLKKALDHGRD